MSIGASLLMNKKIIIFKLDTNTMQKYQIFITNAKIINIFGRFYLKKC